MQNYCLLFFMVWPMKADAAAVRSSVLSGRYWLSSGKVGGVGKGISASLAGLLLWEGSEKEPAGIYLCSLAFRMSWSSLSSAEPGGTSVNAANLDS